MSASGARPASQAQAAQDNRIISFKAKITEFHDDKYNGNLTMVLLLAYNIQSFMSILKLD